MKHILLSCFLLIGSYTYSQNIGINEDGSTPDASAILDIKSDDKGLLVPRLTAAQMNAVASPADGLLIYNTTSSTFWFRQGGNWKELQKDRFDEIVDADGDTKVQVEASPDEDTIKFTIQGVEMLKLSSNASGSPMLETLNSQSTFIGYQAGLNNPAIFPSTFIGYKAGLNNSTGNLNTFIGLESGTTNNSGSRNTFMGSESGSNNAIGSYNSFIGAQAGFNNTTGEANTFVGALAGFNHSTGTSNTLLGSYTGQNKEIGFYNTYLGAIAGLNDISGDGNTYVGRAAGAFQMTTDSYNTLIGISSCANGGGSYNTMLGAFTGNGHDIGGYNVFIGSYAGRESTVGEGNVFIGTESGKNISGDKNVIVGDSAGVNATASDRCVFIGNQAGGTGNSLADRLFIENSNSDSPLIYGEFDNDLVRINGTLEIGTEYSFPTLAGTSGQVLTSSGATTSWQTPVDNVNDADADPNNELISSINLTSNTLNIIDNGGTTSVDLTALVNDSDSDPANELLSSAQMNGNDLEIMDAGGTTSIDLSQFANDNTIVQDLDSDTKIQVEESPDEDIIRFDVTGTEEMTINSGVVAVNGDLAIGHQIPLAKLHIKEEGIVSNQTISAIIESNTSNRPLLLFSENTTSTLADGMSIEYNGVGSGAANKLAINVIGGSPHTEFSNGGDMTVLDGDIRMGSTGTNKNLRMTDLSGNFDRVLTRSNNDVYIGDVDNNGGQVFIRTAGSDRMTIDAAGNIGVNTTLMTGNFNVNGSAAKTAGGSWIAHSDRRLKKHILPYVDGLDKVLAIDPVRYHYNELSGHDTEPEYVGVIAQQLQEVTPYMVSSFEQDDEEYLQVDNSAMIYMLINAVKEQQSLINELEERLKEIESESRNHVLIEE